MALNRKITGFVALATGTIVTFCHPVQIGSDPAFSKAIIEDENAKIQEEATKVSDLAGSKAIAGSVSENAVKEGAYVLSVP